MNRDEVAKLTKILQTLSGELDALRVAGAEIPAVTQNALRMKGTLHALQVQFADLLPREES